MADEHSALAATVAEQLVNAMAGDSWERVKHLFTWATNGSERQVETSRATLAQASEASRDQVIGTEVSAWLVRVRDVLDENPHLANVLRQIGNHSCQAGSSAAVKTIRLTAFWSFLKRRTKEQWLGVVAVATTLSYAFLYFGYFQFYAAFGLHPADVGLDRLHLLQESLLGPLIVPAFLLAGIHKCIWIMTAAFAALLLIGVLIYCLAREVPPWATVRELLAAFFLMVLVGWAVLTAIGYSDLVTMSQSLGREVRGQGKLIDSWVYYGPRSIIVPFLDVQAVPADVTFTSSDASLPSLTVGCVMYLGTAGGVAVLYDLNTQQVIRINAADADLNTHPRVDEAPYYGHLPNCCMPGSS